MENSKDPGISIESISLFKANIEMISPDGKRGYNPALVDLQRLVIGDGKKLSILMEFDIVSGVVNPVMKFECVFIARYVQQSNESMVWDKFSDAMALAHIFPFLREFVFNMTSRLPVEPLMLDPINAHSMVAQYQKITKPQIPS